MGFLSHAQKENPVKVLHEHEMSSWKSLIQRSGQHVNDTTIDVKFYHLDIEIALDSAWITGNVRIVFEPLENGLDQIFLDLEQDLMVDSISSPSASFSHTGNKIWIELESAFNIGEEVELTVYYHGKPSNPGGYKGLVYTDHNNAPVIATLSTPYLAHSWYPCKDGPEDKADSVYIDITIENRVIDSLEVIALSNGILENIEGKDGKKTFHWRHRYPIVTYYVMAAISNYVLIEQEFNDGRLSFPLEYFVFEENYEQSIDGVEDIPDAISLFNELFGNYPFHNEKFGMTELGFYGAIENQTNVIQNTLHEAWFLVSVHELAHMWFADMITCENWHHGWLNEGFATYGEALMVEHQYGPSDYHEYMNGMQYFSGGTVYLQNTEDPFNIFVAIIYYKGAWVLHMLRGVVGDSLFFESLNNYALDAEFRFGHADTEDLQEVFETTCNIDLAYYFDQWVYDEYYPVYNYNFKQASDELMVTIYQSQKDSGWREVFEMPVEIYIQFEDNSDTSFVVENDKVMQTFSFTLEKNVSWVEIDPDRWILRSTHYTDELPVLDHESSAHIIHTLYPNPSTNEVTITLSDSDLLPANFELYNQTGKRIINEVIYDNKTLLNLLSIKEGIYFYKILNNKKGVSVSGKLVKLN